MRRFARRAAVPGHRHGHGEIDRERHDLNLGYRGDFRLSADNEGSTVNLQVEFFIHESGGAIVSRYEDLEPCLRPLGTRRRS